MLLSRRIVQWREQGGAGTVQQERHSRVGGMCKKHHDRMVEVRGMLNAMGQAVVCGIVGGGGGGWGMTTMAGGGGGRYGGDDYTNKADVRDRSVVLGQSLQYDNDNCGRMVLGRSLQYDNVDRGRNRRRRRVDGDDNRGAELTHGSLFLLGTLCSPQLRYGAVQHLIYNTSRQPFNCF